VAIAAVVTVPLCLLFAVRTSVLIFPAVTLILWRGAGPRLLTGVAAGLLGVVVPIAYALSAPPDHGGFNFEYSLDLIRAHWIGVAAIVLLMMACWRTLATARRGRRRSAPPPTSDQPPSPEVEPEDPDLVLAGAADPARPR
jgi:membrane protease YdiL (CAAX protease family)